MFCGGRLSSRHFYILLTRVAGMGDSRIARNRCVLFLSFHPARFLTLKIGLFLFTSHKHSTRFGRFFWKGTVLTRALKYYIIITAGVVSNKTKIQVMHLFKTDERMIFSSRVYALLIFLSLLFLLLFIYYFYYYFCMKFFPKFSLVFSIFFEVFSIIQ